MCTIVVIIVHCAFFGGVLNALAWWREYIHRHLYNHGALLHVKSGTTDRLP